ncbi:hypothetical protein FRB95_002598 [Tulasnella sp. JGI-2019a]|nr:hypothetical protein FRB95_002598 [Tulasnella sp. JGI-2019a]
MDQPLPSLTRFGVDWFYFSGAPSEDVLLFAQAVHQASFAMGPLEDDAWMARYAYGCLKGTALRWYESLEPDTKESWSNLRQAMIERFPPMELAPDAPPAAPAHRLAISNSISRCRVLVVRGDGSVIGYVGPPTIHREQGIHKSQDGALVIDVPIERGTQEGRFLIRILPPSLQSVTYPFLGVESHGTWWFLRACDEGRSGEVFGGRAEAYTATEVAVASSKIWSVKVDKTDSRTEELCMHWVDDKGVPAPLIVCALPKEINSRTEPKTLWMRKNLENAYEPLRLILERF